MVMSVLSRKLCRTIINTRGQFLAVVAVVMVGICVYISMSTAYYNMSRSQEIFYEATNFADYYFQVVRAPGQIVKQIESIPGVTRVTGRIQKDVPLLKEGQQRATARLISYPLPMDNEVNRLDLQQGRLFEKYPQSGGIEILADPQFVKANNLSYGSMADIVAEGKKVPLTLVGSAISPEFIINMKDAATLMPDPKTFGIIMLPQNQAEQILNLSEQINQVVLNLAPGADEKSVVEKVKAVLEPYGNLASYPRKNQLSHTVLQGELNNLQALARFMPAIFLGVAAAIQFIMLGRMLKAQRLQIGVMKALGYGSGQIMLHYTCYSLAVAFAGALLGTLTGVLLASVLSQVYTQYFNLPETIGSLNLKAILYGFILSLGVSLLAGLSAARAVISINPAESMRPEPPKGKGKIFLEDWAWLWNRLGATWKMSIRSLGRKWGRFAITLLGVVFAVALLVLSLFSNDSVNYLINKHFYQEQHYDLLVRFGTPVKEAELLNLSRLEGVIKTEAIFEIPVKLHFKGRSEDDSLQGLPAGLTLKELTDDTGKPLHLPEEGILISRRAADKLGAETGDVVEAETLLSLGPSHQVGLKVMGANRQLVGSSSYISIEQANLILRERGLVTGAMLKVDPGRITLLEEELNEMTNVSSISSLRKELNNLNQNLDSMIYSMSVMVAFAVLLGFALVYNSSVISFAERKRELASLRVIGFTSGEVSGLLLKETLLQSILGVILGLPFGRLMTGWYIKAVSTDLFTLPVIVSPQTYFFSAMGGIFFIALAHLFAVRGIKKLDLSEVLKNRD
jgi:putative ABC transport system permease protein